LVFSAVPLETFPEAATRTQDQKANLQKTKLAPTHHRAHACNHAR